MPRWQLVNSKNMLESTSMVLPTRYTVFIPYLFKIFGNLTNSKYYIMSNINQFYANLTFQSLKTPHDNENHGQ